MKLSNKINVVKLLDTLLSVWTWRWDWVMPLSTIFQFYQ